MNIEPQKTMKGQHQDGAKQSGEKLVVNADMWGVKGNADHDIRGYPVRICTVEGCGAKHRARGLCTRHYGQKYPPGTRWGPLRSDNLKACTMSEGWQASLVSMVRSMSGKDRIKESRRG